MNDLFQWIRHKSRLIVTVAGVVGLGVEAGINWETVSSKGLELISLVTHGSERPEHHHEAHKILATSPQVKPITLTQQYVCQIHSQAILSLRAFLSQARNR